MSSERWPVRPESRWKAIPQAYRPVGQSAAVEYARQCAVNPDKAFTAANFLAFSTLIVGSFNYKTGEQTYLVTNSFLAERLGKGESTVKDDKKAILSLGLLQEVGKQNAPTGGRPIPVYQLCVPARWGTRTRARVEIMPPPQPEPIAEIEREALPPLEHDAYGASLF